MINNIYEVLIFFSISDKMLYSWKTNNRKDKNISITLSLENFSKEIKLIKIKSNKPLNLKKFKYFIKKNKQKKKYNKKIILKYFARKKNKFLNKNPKKKNLNLSKISNINDFFSINNISNRKMSPKIVNELFIFKNI